MSMIFDLLGDHNLQNVALGAALIGMVAGSLGCFAVLRQESLLGDTLSHAALPGVCLGFIVSGTRELGSMLLGAAITGVLAALVMLLLVRKSRLKTDAGLGIALSVFFAIGVVLLTYIQGTGNAAQGGLDSFLFGQAAATLRSDVWLMAGITAVVFTIVVSFWKELKLVTFDPIFASSVGLPVTILEVFLTSLVTIAVVIGLQMVGVVLMAAMVIAPAVAARQWSRTLEQMLLLAACFGVLSGIVGALISATGPGLATGPLMVLCISAIVLISLLFAPERGILWEELKHRRDQRRLRSNQVLATLYDMAAHHKDPAYPTEQGAIDTYFGLATRRPLRTLRRKGLVRQVEHMPDEGWHWELTDKGRDQAEALERDVGRKDG